MTLYRRGQRVPESDIPEEVKAAAARRRLEREAPGYTEALDDDVAAIREEVPPARADPVLGGLMAALRAERERRGLSLTDAAVRSGIERSLLSKLVAGKIANPTYATLRAYAASLGFRLRLLAESDSAVRAGV